MSECFKTRILYLSQSLLCLFVFAGNAFAAPPDIGLTDVEKQWLKAHQTIRLAVDIDWLPFEHIDETGNYSGMAAEYISLMSEKLGVTFEVEKEKTWSQAVDAMKNRELDMFSCVVETDQRKEYVDFTQPYLSFRMVIVTSDKVAYVNGIKDLKNQKVAVVRGYATQDLLEKNHPEIDLYLADNVVDALEKLSHGQVYAYIGNIATVSHVIKQEGLTNIKISGETPYNYELSMAVRNDWPEFVPILQKALNAISEQQRDQIFHKWIQLHYELGFDYTLFWKIFAGLALMAVIVLLWIRRLRVEMARRMEAEQCAQEVHQRLEQVNQKLVDYLDIIDRYVLTSSTDKDGIFTSVSAAFCEISGYRAEELIGQHVRILRHEDMPDSIYESLWEDLALGRTWSGELKNRAKTGGHFWVQIYISPVIGEDGAIIGHTHVRQDITDRKKAEEMSITDDLTGLFNRRHFNTQLPQELPRVERDNNVLGLMIIDVDYFKQFNDNYGHQRGDEVLQSVASTLKGELRRVCDAVFRIGGEEFAVVVSATDDDGVMLIAEKLRKAVEDLQIEHGYSSVANCITVSIGVKICRNKGARAADAEQVYRLADEALYAAKEAGRNRTAEYDKLNQDPLNSEMNVAKFAG